RSRSLFVHSFGVSLLRVNIFFSPLGESMGAQAAKNGAKEETAVEKANGQENGHAKTNGNASPTADGAAEEVQVNGKQLAEGEVKPEDGAAEKPPEEGATESSPVANGEDSSKPEENGSASGSSSEPAKQKKRFSFKKPFKLSGFSFKKSAKKEAEPEEAAAPAEEGKDKAESEEAKPEASEGENEEAAEGAKADQPSGDEEKKTSEEEKPETPAEEKPAEAAAAAAAE
ncbi:myristoylated alanine-rich protein kinase C substrate b, partial [Silurus asotus]